MFTVFFRLVAFRASRTLSLQFVMMLCATVAWVGVSFADAQPEPPSKLSFATYLERVDQGPSTQRLSEAVSLLAAREGEAGLLPDPLVTLGRDRIRLSSMPDKGDSMEGQTRTEVPAAWMLGLSQSFAWPGARGAEGRVAALATARGREQLAVGRSWERFARASDYLEIIVTDMIIALRRESLKELTDLMGLAAIKRGRALSSHGASMRLATEAALAEQDLASLVAWHEALRRRAQVSVGLPPDPVLVFDGALPESQTLGRGGVPAPARAPDSAEGGATEDPLVRATRDLAWARLDARRLARRPSFVLGINLMFEDDEEDVSFAMAPMLGLMAGVTVPLGALQAGDALDAGERAEQRITLLEKDTVGRDAALAASLSRLRSERARAILRTLQEQLIPLNQSHLRLLAAEFAAGQAPAREFNDERRVMMSLREASVRAQAAVLREQWAAELISRSPSLAALTLDLPFPRLDAGGQGMMAGNDSMEGGSGGTGMKPMAPRPSGAGAPQPGGRAPSGGSGMSGEDSVDEQDMPSGGGMKM